MIFFHVFKIHCVFYTDSTSQLGQNSSSVSGLVSNENPNNSTQTRQNFSAMFMSPEGQQIGVSMATPQPLDPRLPPASCATIFNTQLPIWSKMTASASFITMEFQPRRSAAIRRCIRHFYLHPFNKTLVIWPYLTAKQVGNCGLYFRQPSIQLNEDTGIDTVKKLAILP